MDLLSICSLQVRDDLILDSCSGIGQVLNLDNLKLLLLIGCDTVGPTYCLYLPNRKGAVIQLCGQGLKIDKNICTNTPLPSPYVHQVSCH